MATAGGSNDPYKVVAALYIGVSFSGYAYSTNASFRQDPLNIKQTKHWYSDSKLKYTRKTPTCLLLDRHKEFISFGNEAEDQYTELKMKGKNGDYYLIRNLTTQIGQSKVPLTKLEIRDVEDCKNVSAKDVFTAVIRHLRNEVIQQLETHGPLTNEGDIQWVLTCSKFSPGDCRLFMKECAKEAGIPSEQIRVVFEHEAAYAYCIYLERRQSLEQGRRSVEDPLKLILIGLWGKSIEITIIERNQGKQLNILKEKQELDPEISDKYSCSDLVDREFLEILSIIFGESVLKKVQNEKPSTYQSLFKRFQELKYSATPASSHKMILSFPFKTIISLMENSSREEVKKCFTLQNRYNGTLTVLDDCLMMDAGVVISCFSQINKKLVDFIKRVCSEDADVENVVLFGDLAESKIIQTAVENAFPLKTVVVPQEPSLAILKGAVLCGHDPVIIGNELNRKLATSSSCFLAVVAIDFGTAFSGYAYSTTDKYKESPLKITVKNWITEPTTKTGTCVLFNSNQKFVKFGTDALEKYTSLKEENMHDDYYFFENFKMKLYDSEEPLSTMRLQDIQEKANKFMVAKDVFAAAIEAMKDDSLKELNKQGTTIKEEEIRWVITVPAIWPDDAKLFMRESAKQAGISSEKLLIALEPEAASVYSQYQEIQKATESGFGIAESGTKYMVVDIGGGTTDITVHQKLKDGKIKELNKASGTGRGGKSVNEAFFKMLDTMFGKDLMQKLKEKNPKQYLQLSKEFESVKNNMKPDTTGEKHLRFPCTTVDKLLGIENGLDELQKSSGKFKIDTDTGKLVISVEDIKSLFQPTIQRILECIDNALKFEESNDLRLIMLVGGFAKSEMLKQAVRNTYEPSKRIVIPESPGLAVLKGAVLYGHKPDIIDPRVTRFSYGVGMAAPFIPYVHEPSRKIIDDFGKSYCRGSFSMVMKENSVVPLGTVVCKKYTIPPLTTELTLDVYAAEGQFILYTDDPCCRKIGTIEITVPIPSEEERELEVEFHFGNTELSVKATETRYGKQGKASLILD